MYGTGNPLSFWHHHTSAAGLVAGSHGAGKRLGIGLDIAFFCPVSGYRVILGRKTVHLQRLKTERSLGCGYRGLGA